MRRLTITPAQSKRGVAIETALMLIFMLVALSVLLTSVILLSTNLKTKTLSKLSQQVEVQAIAQEFTTICANSQGDAVLLASDLTAFEQGVEQSGKFILNTAVGATNDVALLKIFDTKGNHVLTVGVALSDGYCTITQWLQS